MAMEKLMRNWSLGFFLFDWPYDPETGENRYVAPGAAVNLFNFKFSQEGTTIAAYQKYNRQNYNFNLAYSSQITKEHNIKNGGEYQYYNIANFSLGNEAILKLPSKIAVNPDEIDNIIRRVQITLVILPKAKKLMTVWRIGNNPDTPSFLGIYAQDKIEFTMILL